MTAEKKENSGFLAKTLARFSRSDTQESERIVPDHRATLFPATLNPEPSDAGSRPLNAAGGRYDEGRDLPSMLQSSARRNTDRIDELNTLAGGVKKALVDQANADTSQVAGMLRLFIAAAWIGVGVFYHQAHTSALISNASRTKSGMAVADVQIISSTFLTLGGAAAFAAITLLLLVVARSTSLKSNIQSKSQNFGLRVAQMLKEYDGRLKRHREALSDKARTDDSVVTEVSEAHVTAQEAMLLYEDISFLADARSAETDDQIRGAVRSYRGYLADSGANYNTGSVSAAWSEGLVLGAMIGLFLGAGLGFSFLLEATGYTPAQALKKINIDMINGFDQYPSLLFAILGGATAFAFAGMLAGALANLAFTTDRQDRLRESLNEIRGAVTAENAPRAADIAQRVEDLSEIFRVRLMGRPLGQSLQTTPPATAPGGRALSQTETDDVPKWRRPKEGARFVETAFEAAPKTWRTDAYAQFAAKNSDRATGAKRSLLGFKKPRQD